MAIQLAKAITGAKINAMDLEDEKLKVAEENAADLLLIQKKKIPYKQLYRRPTGWEQMQKSTLLMPQRQKKLICKFLAEELD